MVGDDEGIETKRLASYEFKKKVVCVCVCVCMCMCVCVCMSYHILFISKFKVVEHLNIFDVTKFLFVSLHNVLHQRFDIGRSNMLN